MSMSLPEIERSLKSLRLSGMCDTLEARALQVNQGASTFMEGFALLIQDELDRRRGAQCERRFHQSGLKERKDLTNFDWNYNPKIPKKACFDLVSLGFLRQGWPALLVGQSGTGKSHIAQAAAHAAIMTGYRVLYREAHTLMDDLFEAEQKKCRTKMIEMFSTCDLLVIDDLFLRRRDRNGSADDLQEIIMNRYSNRKSTLITSNRVLEDWGKCLGDQAVASAILDRLLHNGVLLKFQGKSWRLKEAAIRLAKNNLES